MISVSTPTSPKQSRTSCVFQKRIWQLCELPLFAARLRNKPHWGFRSAQFMRHHARFGKSCTWPTHQASTLVFNLRIGRQITKLCKCHTRSIVCTWAAAVPTCYLFSQLALAHVALQEFRKAEAYARTAIDVAEGGCSMHQLMSVENPLAPPPPGTYVATQFESAAADALLLAFDRKNDSLIGQRNTMLLWNCQKLIRYGPIGRRKSILLQSRSVFSQIIRWLDTGATSTADKHAC